MFQPLKTKRAFERISDQVRELIYTGVFKTGDKLPPERELANQFKTGRMVVREALRILEQSGLIYIKYGNDGGAIVKDPDSAAITRSFSDMVRVGNVSLRELTDARIGIENIILEFAIKNIKDEDLDVIEMNIADTEQEIIEGSRATEGNLDFHMLLAKLSKNLLFEMMIEAILNVAKSFLLLMKPDVKYSRKVLNSHKQIYKAIKDKNLQMAKKKMEEHLLDINRKLSEVEKQRKTVFPENT